MKNPPSYGDYPGGNAWGPIDSHNDDRDTFTAAVERIAHPLISSFRGSSSESQARGHAVSLPLVKGG
jgi:hypothetical protein